MRGECGLLVRRHLLVDRTSLRRLDNGGRLIVLVMVVIVRRHIAVFAVLLLAERFEHHLGDVSIIIRGGILVSLFLAIGFGIASFGCCGFLAIASTCGGRHWRLLALPQQKLEISDVTWHSSICCEQEQQNQSRL